MGWIEGISDAINYIENNITEELTIENIAKQAFVSSFYFQKGFAMLCGFTVGEYIRQRRLTLAGSAKVFKYDTAGTEIPKFWTEHYQTGKDKIVCGMYGVCVDESMGSDEFEYLIADNYTTSSEIPDGFVTKVIPKHSWAVFACKGAMPTSLQNTNQKSSPNGCLTARIMKLQRVTILKCTPM